MVPMTAALAGRVSSPRRPGSSRFDVSVMTSVTHGPAIARQAATPAAALAAAASRSARSGRPERLLLTGRARRVTTAGIELAVPPLERVGGVTHSRGARAGVDEGAVCRASATLPVTALAPMGSRSGSPRSERPQRVHLMTESRSLASQYGQAFTPGVSTPPEGPLSAQARQHETDEAQRRGATRPASAGPRFRSVHPCDAALTALRVVGRGDRSSQVVREE